MNSISFSKLLQTFLVAACCFGQKALTPKELLAQIDSQGAKPVVDRLIAHDERNWNHVTGKMETGSDE